MSTGNFKITTTQSVSLQAWEQFVLSSNGGTLFHSLKFLSYHGSKFNTNAHHLVIYKGQTIYGIMPMAIFVDGAKRIAKSPYGSSYGGFIFNKPQNYSDSKFISDLFVDYMSELCVDKVILTFPPQIYYSCYSDTFKLALIENNFICSSRDISSAVRLDVNGVISHHFTSRSRNMARKARKAGVRIIRNAPAYDFYRVLSKTFDKHRAKPTHSLDDWTYLNQVFPDRIYADVAYLDDKPIAGIGYIKANHKVNLSFYLCQDPERQSLQGLSYLVHEALVKSQNENYEWFDFGTSSVNGKGRKNIFQFKESFGAVGVFRETYTWCKY